MSYTRAGYRRMDMVASASEVPLTRPPRLGEHTDEVLGAAGAIGDAARFAWARPVAGRLRFSR